jgi:hypothetical protein
MDGARRALLSMAEIQFAAGASRCCRCTNTAVPYRRWAEARAAIGQLSLDPQLLKVVSAHVMGGCAMAATPEQGVVRPDGKHWQVANLSVHDGSLFPTSIGANPQLSVYGLANMLATHLAKSSAGAACTWCRQPGTGASSLIHAGPAAAGHHAGRPDAGRRLGLALLAQGHPLWALAGALLIVGGYALVLGLEFSLLRLAHGPTTPHRAPAQPVAGRLVGRGAGGADWCSAGASPSCSQRWPDHLPAEASGRRGVLLVHGFVCNRGLWNPWLQRLQRRVCPLWPSIWSRCSAPSTITSASWSKPSGGWSRPRALRR